MFVKSLLSSIFNFASQHFEGYQDNGFVKMVQKIISTRRLAVFSFLGVTAASVYYLRTKQIVAVTMQPEKEEPNAKCSWNGQIIAHELWLNPSTCISEDMVRKVNTAHDYLKNCGFQLRGVQADGNCFFNAFLKSYQSQSQRIPLLDSAEDKVAYLRQQVADQYRRSSNGSKNSDRATSILQDGEWVSSAEGELLVHVFKLSMRILIAGTEKESDIFTYEQWDGESWKYITEEWSVANEAVKLKPYVFIVDLVGHFVYAVPEKTQT